MTEQGRRDMAAAAIDPVALIDSKVRECDLLMALQKLSVAKACWQDAADLYPENEVVQNELGNMLARVLEQYSLPVILLQR